MRHGSRTALALLVSASLLAGCGGKGATVTATTKASSASPSAQSTPRWYRVPAGSMEPTLAIGTRVLVQNKQPKVGDIVVFHPPEGAEVKECGPTPHTVRPGGQACVASLPQPSSVKFIKRIVAGPGDEIYISEGHVFRRAAGKGSFVREHDSYIRPCAANVLDECNFPKAIKVPPDSWYMLGDNRGESDDSRFWGAVPTSWIVGVVPTQ